MAFADELDATPIIRGSLMIYPESDEPRHRKLTEAVLEEARHGRMKVFFIPSKGCPGYVAGTQKAMHRKPPHRAWKPVSPKELEDIMTAKGV